MFVYSRALWLSPLNKVRYNKGIEEDAKAEMKDAELCHPKTLAYVFAFHHCNSYALVTQHAMF